MTDDSTHLNALPLNSMLLEYRLESVLGAGGFGMTYLGWDSHLEKHVAIKEYLPGELAIRALDGSIVPVNTASEYNYKWGLDRFVQEARTLAKFSHPNIIRVNRFFEANGTSYMVMDYEAGESLSQYLQRAPMPAEAVLKSILLPILDGLEAIHEAGFLHRDIKPSNVFMRENGVPVLIDFGASRLVAHDNTKQLTAIVSPGYAPLEQYSGDGNQGPWSDIYALAGVMFRAVTGENPPDAIKRMKRDGVPAGLAAARTRYSERFLKAVEWGLKADEMLRPQNVGQWRELFSGRMPASAFDRTADNAPRIAPHAMAVSAPVAQALATVQPMRARCVTMHPGLKAATATPSSWKWLWRGALVSMVAIATAVLLKPRATEHVTRKPPALQSRPAALQEGPAALPAPGADAMRAATAEEVPFAVRTEFMAADRDADGFLSAWEVRGRFPAIERNLGEVDTDRDGRISLGEFAQFRRKSTGGKLPQY